MIRLRFLAASFVFVFCSLSYSGLMKADDGKHLFILSGQSNMAGLRPQESFTPAVIKAFGKDNVIVVHDAHGGQPIRRWDKSWKKDAKQAKQKPGDLYARLMTKVKSAVGKKGLKSVTFLWMQGERDAREKNADLYADSLKRVVGQVAEDLNHKSVHVVVGRLSDFDMNNKRYPHWTRIREVQVAFAKNRPNTAWVDTDDLNDGKNRRGKEIKNDLHYSGEGYKIFGDRLAKKAIEMIRKPAESPKAKSGSESKEEASPVSFPIASRERFDSAIPNDKVDLNSAKPDSKIAYKKVGDVTLHLHVFKPEGHRAGDKRPAIVFFFGGGWNGGTPSQFYKQSRYLTHRGMIAFCAEYRTRSKNKTSPKECVKDGKSAIRFVRAQAAKLGVDPKRIAAGGGSAGGHVAAATATVNKFDEESDPLDVSPRPNALVLFNPVYDNSSKGYGYDRVKDYWKDFSPMHNLSKSTPPTTVFLGTNDKLIPVATGKSFQSKMKELGCRSELHLYDGKPHGFFNSGESFVDTVEKMDLFLASLKYIEGKPDIRELLPKGPQRKNSGKKKKNKKAAKKKKI